jgi:hypothetical protein
VDHPAERSDFREVKGIDRAPAGEQFENKSLWGSRMPSPFGRQRHSSTGGNAMKLPRRKFFVWQRALPPSHLLWA